VYFDECVECGDGVVDLVPVVVRDDDVFDVVLQRKLCVVGG